MLYEAELGNLNRHCTLSVYPNQPYFDTLASLQSSTRYHAQPQPPFTQSFPLQEYPQYFQSVPNYSSFQQSPSADTEIQQSFIHNNSDQLVQHRPTQTNTETRKTLDN